MTKFSINFTGDSVEISFHKKVWVFINGPLLKYRTTEGLYDWHTSTKSEFYDRNMNPWAFWWLSKQIFHDVTNGWEPKKHITKKDIFGEDFETIPYEHHKWIQSKLGKKHGKQLHQCWLQLLSKMDQQSLLVSRALFSANFRDAKDAGILFLEDYNKRDKYLLKDIVNYRAAAMWAGHDIDYVNDWTSFYARDFQTNKAARKTIQNLPGCMPWYLVNRMSQLHIERPLLTRLELVTALAMSDDIGGRDIHLPSLNKSTKDDVKNSYNILKRENHIIGTLRKSENIVTAAHYIADYPENYRGNFVGLTNKSIKWHNQIARNRPRTTYGWSETDLKDEQEVVKPHITIDKPNIKLLDTVGAIRDEGQKMGHCIAGYSNKAVKGRCYLFHIEYNGEHASAEVDGSGYVLQCRGPRNQQNKATEYGRIQLQRLFSSKKLMDNMEREICNNINMEFVPF